MGSFWDPFWGAKIDPKSLRRFRVDGLDFDLVIDWSQDGLKTVPRELLGGFLGRLGGVLSRSWGLLGPLWRVLGCFWAVLRGSWALLERSWRPMRLSTGRFGMRLVDSIHRFDLRCDSSIRFVHWIELWFCIMSSTPLDSTTPPGGMRHAIK